MNDNGIDTGALPDLLKRCNDAKRLAVTAVWNAMCGPEGECVFHEEDLDVSWEPIGDGSDGFVVLTIDASTHIFHGGLQEVVRDDGERLKAIGVDEIRFITVDSHTL